MISLNLSMCSQMNRAYAEAKRQAKNAPKNPAVKKKAVNLIAMHMVFGEK